MKFKRFALYNLGLLAYMLLVIMWGAFVRATGSGAGCGAHWPLCNGAVIPRSEQAATLIEFTHRLSSGLAFILVVGLAVWAWRAYPRGHRVRWGAGVSLLFIIIEALVGAGLVLFQWVGDNASVARAVVIALHLVNTFMLLAALTLTAWWASGGRPVRLKGRGGLGWALGLGFGAMLVLGASGAVTALGDTLFSPGSVAEGLRQDFSPTAHFLVRLRLLHPLIAVGVGVYLILIEMLVNLLRPHPFTRRLARVLTVLFVGQLAVGGLNVLLLAPVWMQLVHLLISDLIWIVLVLLGASVLAEPGMADSLN